MPSAPGCPHRATLGWEVFRIALQENMQYPISKFQMLRANMSLMIKRSQFTKKVRCEGGAQATVQGQLSQQARVM